MLEPACGEQTAIERLAEVLRVHVRRDECNDQVIQGASGNVHEDGQGYSVAVMLHHGRSLRVALEKLAGFCKVRQHGDTEAVLHVERMPTPEQAAALREVLGVRKIPVYSPEVLERKRESLARAIQARQIGASGVQDEEFSA